MEQASSFALSRRHRDNLAVVVAVLLLVGLFGAVTHGMESGRVVAVQPTRDLTDVAPRPEVEGQVVTAPTVPVTTTPPTTARRAGFVARDIGVRADFGGTPQRLTQQTSMQGVTVDVTMYAMPRGNTMLLLGSSTVPEMGDSTFDDLVKGFAFGFQSEVASTRTLTFQGHEARDVTLRMKNGGVAHALLVMLDGRVVEIIVSAPTDPENEYRRFVETVELL